MRRAKVVSRASVSTLAAIVLIMTAQGVAEAGGSRWDTVSAPLVHLAQANATPAQLPGGATSLRETHGDWIVMCNAAPKAKVCGVSQQQADGRSGQRVLAIEVGSPSADGAHATLVLPFGLKLDKGVVLQVDETAATTALAFKTCLPAGCIVDAALNRQSLEGWRKGTSLKLKSFAADSGSEVRLAISLKGLAQAMDRASALAR